MAMNTWEQAHRMAEVCQDKQAGAPNCPGTLRCLQDACNMCAEEQQLGVHDEVSQGLMVGVILDDRVLGIFARTYKM